MTFVMSAMLTYYSGVHYSTAYLAICVTNSNTTAVRIYHRNDIHLFHHINVNILNVHSILVQNKKQQTEWQLTDMKITKMAIFCRHFDSSEDIFRALIQLYKNTADKIQDTYRSPVRNDN